MQLHTLSLALCLLISGCAAPSSESPASPVSEDAAPPNFLVQSDAVATLTTNESVTTTEHHSGAAKDREAKVIEHRWSGSTWMGVCATTGTTGQCFGLPGANETASFDAPASTSRVQVRVDWNEAAGGILTLTGNRAVEAQASSASISPLIVEWSLAGQDKLDLGLAHEIYGPSGLERTFTTVDFAATVVFSG